MSAVLLINFQNQQKKVKRKLFLVEILSTDGRDDSRMYIMHKNREEISAPVIIYLQYIIMISVVVYDIIPVGRGTAAAGKRSCYE